MNRRGNQRAKAQVLHAESPVPINTVFGPLAQKGAGVTTCREPEAVLSTAECANKTK